MNIGYWAVMALGCVLSALVLSARLKGANMPPSLAALMLVMCAALGFIGAKAGYALIMIGRLWPRYGAAAFLRMNAWEFSFFFGCAGAALGAGLTAKIAGRPMGAFLDAVAPCGALMACFARGAEYFLDMLGVGAYLEDSFFCRFPFAVQNEWEEWFWAVFMLEALLALGAAVWALTRKKEGVQPGLLFARTGFYLCLPQIFCESLRSSSVTWGFVRAEQLLCALCVTGIVALHCVRAGKTRGRFAPVAGVIVCIALLVFVEFALDRGVLYVTNKLVGLPRQLETGGVPYNTLVCYGLMWLGLGVMGWMENIAVRRRMRR